MTFNVTFKRASVEAAFEVGSLSELAGYIQEHGNELSNVFGSDMEMVVKSLAASGSTAETTITTTEANGDAPRRSRGRPPKPAPDPVAPPPAPVDTAPNANGVPNFLDRTTPAAPPPPPPPVQAAPPVPPAPPSGILAGKVIAELDRRGVDDGSKKQLVDWLVGSGFVNAGATYDESISAIRLMNDDRLKPAADALSVA